MTTTRLARVQSRAPIEAQSAIIASSVGRAALARVQSRAPIEARVPRRGFIPPRALARVQSRAPIEAGIVVPSRQNGISCLRAYNRAPPLKRHRRVQARNPAARRLRAYNRAPPLKLEVGARGRDPA